MYIGKNTRCSTPSARCSSGRKSFRDGPKFGLPAPAVDPGVKVGDSLGQVFGLVREVRAEPSERRLDPGRTCTNVLDGDVGEIDRGVRRLQ